MKRYKFDILNTKFDVLCAYIPDGNTKQIAFNRAKIWMRENGLKSAFLEVSSTTTGKSLDIIPINL